MMDRSDDPSHHERTLLPQSYISLLTSKKSVLYDSKTVRAIGKIRINCGGGGVGVVVWGWRCGGGGVGLFFTNM